MILGWITVVLTVATVVLVVTTGIAGAVAASIFVVWLLGVVVRSHRE